MPKGRGRRDLASRRNKAAPYPSIAGKEKNVLLVTSDTQNSPPTKDWEDAICSVCMDYPHNAVLLLCSSHDKGCRPYMCGTSYRHSNCLDQFRKAYTKSSEMATLTHPSEQSVESPTSSLESLTHLRSENAALGREHQVSEFHRFGLLRSVVSDSEDASLEETSSIELAFNGSRERWGVTELACPLCRGQVKGWTVVEPARKYLNAKKRSCAQDSCPFVGTYEELRKHARREHPLARPQEIDPDRQRNWRRLERQRDHADVMSTIRSTMPGAMVLGDYVIEGNNVNNEGDDSDFTGDDNNWLNVFLLFQAFRPAANVANSRNIPSRLRGLARGYHGLGLSSIMRRGMWGGNFQISAGSEGNRSEATDSREEDEGSSRRRRRSRRRSPSDLI